MFLYILFINNISQTYLYPCGSSSSCNNLEVSLPRGIYKFECWGAQGGTGRTDGVLKFHGGNGAYVSGIINIEYLTNFYLYIGGKGGHASSTSGTSASSGWNGGGRGGIDTRDNDASGGGGGSTDIRLFPGNWNDLTSLRSRLMVAAGGSGSCFNSYGAPGGNITGFDMKYTGFYDVISTTTTTQITGNSFGIGANGLQNQYTPSSGGGGGYYGGVANTPGGGYTSVSDSGSSFISGHKFCNAINKDGIHLNYPYHYSGLYFYNTSMLTGIEYQPGFLNENLILGNSNNGTIRITYIGQYITNNNIQKYSIVFLIQFYILII